LNCKEIEIYAKKESIFAKTYDLIPNIFFKQFTIESWEKGICNYNSEAKIYDVHIALRKPPKKSKPHEIIEDILNAKFTAKDIQEKSTKELLRVVLPEYKKGNHKAISDKTLEEYIRQVQKMIKEKK
jgi:hypothetical protein